MCTLHKTVSQPAENDHDDVAEEILDNGNASDVPEMQVAMLSYIDAEAQGLQC